MPPIILPQAFLHAPNTFKPVSHIGAMNNTSSTVLNFKNVVYSMRSCPKTQALSLKVFHYYISVHCPQTQASSPYVFTIIISVHCPKTRAKMEVPASRLCFSLLDLDKDLLLRCDHLNWITLAFCWQGKIRNNKPAWPWPWVLLLLLLLLLLLFFLHFFSHSLLFELRCVCKLD